MSNNQEQPSGRSLTTVQLRGFFDRALEMQEEKSKGYGDSWRQGRPVGITDNLLWIAVRIQNNEKRYIRLLKDFEMVTSELEKAEVNGKLQKCSSEIEDDIIDLAVFTGFRYIMHIEETPLI